MPVCVRSVVDKVVLGKICLRVLRLFLFFVIPPLIYADLHLNVFLTRRTKFEAWKPSKEIVLLYPTSGLWIEKYFNFLLKHVNRSNFQRRVVKVKFALEQVMKTQRGRRGIALFFL
jgi:hypothetical protein